MKKSKHFLSVILLMGLMGMTALADGIVPYVNYNYSESDGGILTAPQAYTPDEVIYGHEFGIGSFASPTDIHTDDEGNIYLLDAGNSRLVVFSSDWKLQRVIKGFTNDGKSDDFTDARGLYIDDTYIYIADTSHQRIVILDKMGALQKTVGAPKSSMLGNSFIFKPIRVAVDPDRLLYVVGEGTFEGIITMDWDGKFAGFVGSNNVKPSAWDIFWMQYSTVEQRSKMVQFVPQDFSSIDVDDKGFFFCTTYTQQNNQMVKRLNPGGSDVIRSLSRTDLVGDPTSVPRGSLKGLSSFYDVAAQRDGIYACLDYTRGKIFCYNHDGYLLYTFGALSTQDGGFSKPVALTWLSDDAVAVVDNTRLSVTVFRPTKYAQKIHEGIAAQEALNHDLAYEKWQDVLKLNNNFELAHIQIGKVYLSTGKSESAMQEFKLGGSKALYSKAFGQYRAKWIYDNISVLLLILVVVIAAIIVVVQVLKRRRKNEKVKRAVRRS